ncbi:MAG TPA: hypothetical protein VFQ88_14110 [Nevskiaceae bacterium]|nr:hypothetical protein [Nevskiaceae bacterium]
MMTTILWLFFGLLGLALVCKLLWFVLRFVFSPFAMLRHMREATYQRELDRVTHERHMAELAALRRARSQSGPAREGRRARRA